MARYRKGGRYLSEEEYREEKKNNWILFLFIIGAIVGGYLTYGWIAGFDLPKWFRFVSVILSGIIGGGVLGALHRQIQLLIGFSILAGIIYIVSIWLWNKM